MAKNVMKSIWKPSQAKKPVKTKKTKSTFYCTSPQDDGPVFSPNWYGDRHSSCDELPRSSVNASVLDTFFQKYNIQEEAKTEFVKIMKAAQQESNQRINSRQPKYRDKLHSTPGLYYRSSSPASQVQATCHPKCQSEDDSKRSMSIDTHESYIGYMHGRGFDAMGPDVERDSMYDDSCVFHHRCRSTSIDEQMTQFQISVCGSTTTIICDSNTIIIHGVNAEMIGQNPKIAVKLYFNNEDGIIARMGSRDFLKELCEMLLQKKATPLEIGKGCVELWVSFDSTDALNEFCEDYQCGTLRVEFSKLLLRHGYVKNEEELEIKIKDNDILKTTQEPQKIYNEISSDAVFPGVCSSSDVFPMTSVHEETPFPVNFMLAAFGCKTLAQLDIILTLKYKKMSLEDGFNGYFSISETYPDAATAIPESTTTFPTLLHFAAYYGLRKLCSRIADTPGYMEALTMKNADGLIPADMVPASKPHLRDMLNVINVSCGYTKCIWRRAHGWTGSKGKDACTVARTKRSLSFSGIHGSGSRTYVDDDVLYEWIAPPHELVSLVEPQLTKACSANKRAALTTTSC